LFLNRANKVLGIYDVSTGGVSGTVADPRVIFVAALKANCCGIIISHNHPSGNLKPSRQDEELQREPENNKTSNRELANPDFNIPDTHYVNLFNRISYTHFVELIFAVEGVLHLQTLPFFAIAGLSCSSAVEWFCHLQQAVQEIGSIK
jgi:hypothetical protein